MKKNKICLWFLWVSATGGGWVIGLGAALAFTIHKLEPDPAAVLLIGGIMAAAQGWILRRTFAWSRWAAGTLLGGYGGGILAALLLQFGMHPLIRLFLGESQGHQTSNLLLYDLAMLAGGALCGALVGAGQWLSVRRQWPQSGLWVWVNSLAVGLAAFLGTNTYLELLLNLRGKYASAWLIPGLVYGAASGAAFWRWWRPGEP